MNKLRVGVIGVGHIGSNHARLYRGIGAAEFTAIYDVDANRAKAIGKKCRVNTTRSFEEFVEVVDAVSVATPTNTHYQIARPLLERGKHLLIEKPITENTKEASELSDLAARNGLILQVGHVERFNPVLSALEARLTHPRFIEAHRLSPYPNRSTDISVVLDLMIHDLEIILHLVRSPVQNIDAVGVPVLSRSEDIANARIHFENGCVANITSSRISPDRMRKIRVFQEDAYLSLDYEKQSGEIYRREAGQITRDKVPIERGEPLKHQLISFIECAATGRQPRVSGFQATAALELAVEITKRMQTVTAAYDRRSNHGASTTPFQTQNGYKTKSIYLVAGEASADNHGAALMRALREIDSGLAFMGRGGPQMEAVAGPLFKNWIKRSGVLGFWEVIRRYPFFRRQFQETLSEIEQAQPDAVVLIDYPGFNLRLAHALRRNQAARKIIYYISPQVWAWNRGRIKKMARWLDLVLCIFPFEAELYNRSGLRAVFVGHPMMERLPEHKVDTGRDPNLIGLFPGSRSREIRKIFPILLETSRKLRLSKPNLRFEIAAASAEIAWDIQKVINWHRTRRDLDRALEANGALEIKIGETNAVMQRAFVGIVASGSAALEAAYFRLPFVLVYKVYWLTYFLGRLVVRIKFLGMPNVLANKEIVPEYIQHRASENNLARAVSRLIDEPSAREKMISEFDKILAKLGDAGASERAATAIADEIR